MVSLIAGLGALRQLVISIHPKYMENYVALLTASVFASPCDNAFVVVMNLLLNNFSNLWESLATDYIYKFIHTYGQLSFSTFSSDGWLQG